jgi:uncharacterized protein (DUF2345 family)
MSHTAHIIYVCVTDSSSSMESDFWSLNRHQQGCAEQLGFDEETWNAANGTILALLVAAESADELPVSRHSNVLYGTDATDTAALTKKQRQRRKVNAAKAAKATTSRGPDVTSPSLAELSEPSFIQTASGRSFKSTDSAYQHEHTLQLAQEDLQITARNSVDFEQRAGIEISVNETELSVTIRASSKELLESAKRSLKIERQQVRL